MKDLDELKTDILSLHSKIDRVLAHLETLAAPTADRPRRAKPKATALTPEETTAFQARFNRLYERWKEGHEFEVQGELDGLDADQLRRFADANNLNVTSKMPKEKVLHLIGARFREKKQLHKITGPNVDHTRGQPNKDPAPS
jgi:hypothetical protein